MPRDGGGTVSLRIAASRKPVIVAVNGPAVGVGATMTLPADVRIAGQSARFGFVFARRGLVPEAASSWFLPRVVGISQAMEWVATGRVFDAAEALGGRLDSLAMFRLGQSADVVEGVTSFLEKRPPKFPGLVADFAGIVPLWPLRPETMD